MSLERSVRLLAGCMILLSLALTYFVSPWWLLLTTFVGLNLIQSSFTKWCLAEEIFKKTFYKNRQSTARQPKPVSVKR